MLSPVVVPLQPGDCVILNAPNSTVGRTVLQLCKLLKLRAVAVLRCKPSSAAADDRFEAVAEQLRGLGVTLVLRDEGSVKVSSCNCNCNCSLRSAPQFAAGMKGVLL
jgi:trans-2-enoyl-CoA reductase